MIRKTLKYIIFFGIILLIVLEVKKNIEVRKENSINDPLCKNCDVLLISIDTLSAKHLPCYGYDKNTAPNLCQFAKDNIYFSNSYSPSHWTRPSQTSVLTGLNPTTHGVLNAFTDQLMPKFKTIQEMFQSYGYKTYFYGPKIDNDSWDTSVIRGFDVNMSDEYTNNGVAKWNEALDILAKNKKNHTPTFMYLHTYYVHDPYFFDNDNVDNFKYIKKEDIKKNYFLPITKNEYNYITPDFENYVIKQIQGRIKQGGTKESMNRLNGILADLIKARNSNGTFDKKLPPMEAYSYLLSWYFVNLKKADPKYLTSIYDEMISKMDSDIKVFLERLGKDFNKDTIVVIYGDHGQTLGERGSVGHCGDYPYCLYNETIKVPLIFKIPGKKNEKIEELAQGIDIYPTILKALGKDAPSYVEGEDLTGLISGKTDKRKSDFIVSEEAVVQKAIIDRRWKLYFKEIHFVTKKNMELYDLVNDPWEKHNVIDKYPEVVNEKINQLNLYLRNQSKFEKPVYNFPDWIDNSKREKLMKEGYF